MSILQLYEIWRVLRAQFPLLIATFGAFALIFTAKASAAEPKRVLLIHSFGSAAPPTTALSIAFERALEERMGKRVDLDQVSLDMARYADRDMQEAIVDYLQKRQAKWKPDLVVTSGAPAAVFVASYRDRVFPETPVIYTTLDRRLLPQGALEKNAVYIGQVFEVPGWIEDMLQIAPATKNIEVVVGTTALERTWQESFQKAAEPYTGRIKFTYYNDLSFDQMLARVAKLPSDSYIFFLLLRRDASGVTHNADEALPRLHEVANAPINGIFSHQLGMGIVGGRLYQTDRVGKEAADVAIRILHGEPASSFPPVHLDPLPPRYDWRELKRWNISEKLLPAGSTVVFREPTVWDRYRTLIIGGISICFLQALLITGLLVNLIRRRRAEVSLGESEKRFQTMADAAPIMIWVSGEDKLCTYVNKAWLEFTGRSAEQDLGNGWSEVHPDDVEKALQTYSSAFDAREPFVMQYRLKRYDGEYRRVTDQGVPRYGSRGNFRGYVGACVDITELLEKEQALHEFEERVTLAAEAAHLGVWELNTKTGELWMSDKARDLFQFSRETSVSYKDFQDRVHPEDRALRDSTVQRSMEMQGGYEIEYRTLLPDGTVRWIGARARCVTDEDGAQMRLLGVSMDVTERKEAQELFQLATEASPSGTLLVDDQGRIILVNAHIEELFGYEREELIGKPIEVLVPERFAREHVARRAEFLGAPKLRPADAIGEVSARRKDGTEFSVEVGLNPIQTPHGILVLATVVDISQRKFAEEEARRQREQISLLTRVSLLGEMTASLAHELNQPLSAIMSNANAAKQYIEKGRLSPEQFQEILTDVIADGERAHNIIHNVRNAIKKGSAIRGRINLNDVVRAVRHLISADAAAQGCKVEMSLAEDLPTIEGDPTQMQQVLINLVRNALDAMRDAPPNRREVEIATNYDGNATVCVAVRDHGCGISETAGERLFEQFFTTKEEGLGMGLAIVRSIIDDHGGRIAAENVDGGGARFYFNLPISEKGPQ